MSTPKKDACFTNLSVQDSLVVGNRLAVREKLLVPMAEILFTPVDGVFATSIISNRLINKNMVNISISGVVTGDVGGTAVLFGSIPQAFAPTNAIVVPFACTPFGILVGQLTASGEFITCVTGAPIPIGSYNITVSMFYIIE